MTIKTQDTLAAAAALGARDAVEGREPLWYRVESQTEPGGYSYVSAESGQIGSTEVGAAYVEAYRAAVAADYDAPA